MNERAANQPPRAKRNVRPFRSSGGSSDVHPEKFGRNGGARNPKRRGCERADSERKRYENGGDYRECDTTGHRRTQLSDIGLTISRDFGANMKTPPKPFVSESSRPRVVSESRSQ